MSQKRPLSPTDVILNAKRARVQAFQTDFWDHLDTWREQIREENYELKAKVEELTGHLVHDNYECEQLEIEVRGLKEQIEEHRRQMLRKDEIIERQRRKIACMEAYIRAGRDVLQSPCSSPSSFVELGFELEPKLMDQLEQLEEPEQQHHDAAHAVEKKPEQEVEPSSIEKPPSPAEPEKLSYIVCNAGDADAPCETIKMVAGDWQTSPDIHHPTESDEQNPSRQGKNQREVLAAYPIGDWNLLHHVGSTCDTLLMRSKEVELAEPVRRAAAIRANFYASVSEETIVEVLEKALNDPSHPFWRYEELSHRHTVENAKRGDAQILYVAPNVRKPPMPPRYSFTPFNIVTRQVYDLCALDDASRTFAELAELPDNQRVMRMKQQRGLCENWKACVCDKRFEMLYGAANVYNRKYVLHEDRVLVDHRDDFVANPGLVMECTDACGCSRACPRRLLQQGHRTDLIVCYEGQKGFGLRAAGFIKRGTLITEYNGLLTVQTDDANGDAYEANCKNIMPNVVIGSADVGNVSRFANHSCVPNAMFVQVHSRVVESEPLIPRIALFAEQDIELGDEITFAYWNPEEAPERGGIPCRCGAGKACMGRLPVATIVKKTATTTSS